MTDKGRRTQSLFKVRFLAGLSLFCCMLSAWGDTMDVDGYRWGYYRSWYDTKSSVTITSVVKRVGATFKKVSGAVNIPARLGNYTVTGIERAFEDCTALTSVTFPPGLRDVGYSSFAGCTALASIHLPPGVKRLEYRAFADCTALSAVTLPEGVKSIGREAFRGCTVLASISIPESVTAMENNVFGATALYNQASSGVLIVSGWVVDVKYFCPSKVRLPQGTRGIANDAFRGCRGLTSISITEGVTYIGDDAFQGCTGLTSISVPEGVTYIGDDAFQGCTGLSSVSLQKGVVHVGWDAFSGCRGLTSISLPEGLAYIGMRAFKGCTGLASISFPEGLNYIDMFAFEGCTGLTSISIPEGVVGISDGAFGGCTGLSSITLPDSLRYVGENAFDGTALLDGQPEGVLTVDGWVVGVDGTCPKKVVLPSGTRGIGNGAFCEEGLTSITIPSSVVAIGDGAFSDCERLTSVDIPEGVLVLGACVFDGCNRLSSLKLPDSLGYVSAEVLYGGGTMLDDDSSLIRRQPDGVLSIDGWIVGVKRTCPMEIAFPEGTRGIAEYAFSDEALYYDWDLYEGDGDPGKLLSLTVVTIPASVGRIGAYAFDGAKNLSRVVFRGRPPVVFDSWWELQGGYALNLPYGGSMDDVDDVVAPWSDVVGTYPSEYATEWQAVITNGMWHGIRMREDVITLDEALDNTTLTFGTDGDVPWSVQTDEFHSGGSAARSGAIDHGAETRLTTTVSGPGTLSFWWKVSSEQGYDKLSISVDDVERADISGEQGWAQKTVPVTGSSTHTVVWTYHKDGSVSGGSDCGWVDLVEWSPLAPLAPPAPPVADAAWTFVRGASAAKPAVLVSPDGKWRLRAAGPEDGTVYVSFYNPLAEDESEEWEFRSCVERGGADLTLPVRARDEGNGRVYDVAFLGECFTDYTALRRVTVPDALDADLAEAFLGVPNLASFAVGGGNPRYFARDGALFVHEQDGYANVLLHYPNGKAGTAYTVPEGVEAVSAWAFGNYGKLKTVTLPASLRSWGTDSDWGNDNEWYAASRLERIELADGNPYLKVAGGALYTADGETLLRYPPARAGASVVVEYGTERIAPAAFAYAGKLTSVSFPEYSLREIGSCAFSRSGLTHAEVPEGVEDIADAFCSAKKLATVSLPTTLLRIDDGAFDSCTALKRVDITNPDISLRGDGCGDGDNYICWGEGLPAAFGIRVPSESGITQTTSGHFHDAAKRRRAVPILGTSVKIRLDVFNMGCPVWTMCFSGEKFDLAELHPSRCFYEYNSGDFYNLFTGWWYTGKDDREVHVTADTVVPNDPVTLVPGFVDLRELRSRLIADTASRGREEYREGNDVVLPDAVSYDGYLYDPWDVNPGAVVGTISVKLAAVRTDRRTGQTTRRVTATVQVAGGRRVSLSRDMDSNWLSIPAGNGRVLELIFWGNGVSGTFDGYAIDGARNVFVSRTVTDKERASEALSRFKDETVNLAWESTAEEDGTPCGWNGFSVKVGSAGRTRVTGTLADGTKVSATAQLIVGGEWCCVPVVVDRRPHRFGFNLWLATDGSCVEAEGLDGDVRLGRAGTIGAYGDAAFYIDTGALGELFDDWTYEGYGPDGVSVEQVGTKWRVAGGARPGRVVLDRDGFVDEAKAGENPSALTLAYRAKEGTFTGAFKYYVPSARGAPVAKTVNVYGVVVEGVGYGTAVVRGKGAVSVTVE